jgi:hypothetical protein
MYFLKPRKVDELIISQLLKGEFSTKELLLRVRELRSHNLKGKDTTKQSFYAALRKLRREDIVITYKKNVSLNTTWLGYMRDMFDQTHVAYTSGKASPDFLSLSDRESVTYNFSTIKNMDTFWGHTWNILTHTIPPTEPLYIYDPHYWFYIARHDLERKFQKEITARKRQYLMSVAGNTPLDKIIKKDFQGEYLQYNYDPIFGKGDYYMTVIGDYIAEAYLDQKAVAKIEYIFGHYKTVTPEVVRSLQEVLDAPLQSKIKISRNKAKAEKLKRRLGKNFYVKNK